MVAQNKPELREPRVERVTHGDTVTDDVDVVTSLHRKMIPAELSNRGQEPLTFPDHPVFAPVTQHTNPRVCGAR